MSNTDWDAIQREIWTGVGALASAAANLELAMYQLYCRLVGSPLAEVVAMGEGFSFTSNARRTCFATALT